MSIEMMNLVWYARVPDPAEKFLLVTYADHANDEGENIFPAVTTMARKTSYSERNVQRVTKRLVEQGYLIEDGQGPKGTNKWRLNVDLLASLVNPEDLPKWVVQRFPKWSARQEADSQPKEDDNLLGAPSGQEGVTSCRGGVTSCHRGGDNLTPEPSCNRQEKPSYVYTPRPEKESESENPEKGSSSSFGKPAHKNKHGRESGKNANGTGRPPGQFRAEIEQMAERIRGAWAENFPDKPQPDSEQVLSLLHAHWQDAEFQANVLPAIEKAAKSTLLQREKWFQLAWLLKNGDGIRKVMNGEYDWANPRVEKPAVINTEDSVDWNLRRLQRLQQERIRKEQQGQISPSDL